MLALSHSELFFLQTLEYRFLRTERESAFPATSFQHRHPPPHGPHRRLAGATRSAITLGLFFGRGLWNYAA
ncbi:MAG: hypothetical protein MUC60_07215 [Oscillatoria sp. Prado101]|jgi:hypothetical protein|nr:hypothetical protein [Oscillatoria sp. Prado101]